MSETVSIAIKPNIITYKDASSVVDAATMVLFFLKEKAKFRKGKKF